ncbi:hypothetical protein HDU67_000414 [Dinochytrium kinnereticum]|nr:hypothetical protein HDU67_000414 [Dinochytrium kinnereticum]
MTRSRKFEGRNIKTPGNNGKFGVKKNGHGHGNWGVEGEELMDIDFREPARSPTSPSTKIQVIPQPAPAVRPTSAASTATGGGKTKSQKRKARK